MVCEQCGQPLTDDSRFCPKCGVQTQREAGEPRKLVRPGLVTLLAVLQFLATIAFGVLGLLVAVRVARENPLALGFTLLLLGFAATHCVCGLGLLKLRPYGRVIQLGFSILGLAVFPVGTVISLPILFYLCTDHAKVLFSGKTSDQLTKAEAVALEKEPSMGVVLATLAVVSVALVFFGGIVAAIAIPNFLNAIDRGKQKRTMADLRSMATVIEEYSIDNAFYPRASTVGELERYVVPEYVRSLPASDGWGNAFIVQSSPEEYVLLSTGKGGFSDQREPVGPTNTFESDIVFSNGSFVQWPEGRQR